MERRTKRGNMSGRNAGNREREGGWQEVVEWVLGESGEGEWWMTKLERERGDEVKCEREGRQEGME